MSVSRGPFKSPFMNFRDQVVLGQICYYSTYVISYSIHGTGIFTYIYHRKSTIHVGKYTIHGSYGYWILVSNININIHVLWLFQKAKSILPHSKRSELFCNTQVLSPDWKAENRKGKGICTLTVSDSFKSPMRLSWHIIWLSGFQSAESWHRRDLSTTGVRSPDAAVATIDRCWVRTPQNVVARTLEAISWDEDVETSKREVSHQLEVYNIYKLTSFFFPDTSRYFAQFDVLTMCIGAAIKLPVTIHWPASSDSQGDRVALRWGLSHGFVRANISGVFFGHSRG